MRVEYTVDLGHGRAKRNSSEPKKPQAQKPNRTRQHRLARLLALAYHFDHMIRIGRVNNMAEIAHMCHVSRARISAIMSLLALSPHIQEEILLHPADFQESRLLTVAQFSLWERQVKIFATKHP